MVMISVEFLLTHAARDFDVSRVPCVGELVALEDDVFEVREVIHKLDPDAENDSIAIVRVK